MTTDEQLRKTFDTEAELYNKMRPGYPQEVFDTLIAETEIDESSRLLETGPGTGQATRSLVALGCPIVAVELGGALADVARRELAPFENVELVTGAFEDVELPNESFDLIYSATAFHWIRPEAKYAKTSALLKQGGHLAIIHRHHLGGDDFYTAVNPVYRKYREERPKSSNEAKARASSVDDIKDDLVFNEQYFTKVFHAVIPHTMRYTADEFVQLVGTYSPTLAMSQERRDAFLGEIHDVIKSQFNGSVTRDYGISLTIGRKV